MQRITAYSVTTRDQYVRGRSLRRVGAAVLLAVGSIVSPMTKGTTSVAAVDEVAVEEVRRHGAVGREGSGPDTLADGVQILEAGAHTVRVTPLKGLERPWALAFLPDGGILVTERPGRLRRISPDFRLDPQPIAGVPEVLNSAYKGLMDVALHPDYDSNRWVYFTFSQRLPGETDVDWDRLTGPAGTIVLARGRYDGAHQLTDVEELFTARAATSGVSAARLAFAADRSIFLSIGAPSYTVEEGGTNRVGSAREAQDPMSHAGKVLHLLDDGSPAEDNPFLGVPGYLPEIFALGVRNTTGLFVHPDTQAAWTVEHGPLGGDEINVIRAGANYGWPLHSYGRAYSGARTGEGSGPIEPLPSAPGIEEPFLFWSPNIAPGGMSRYQGAAFPAWQGDLLIGGLASTQLHRVDLNDRGLPEGREVLLQSLGQRIREVRTSPQGLVYLLTDHDLGAILRVEPNGS